METTGEISKLPRDPINKEIRFNISGTSKFAGSSHTSTWPNRKGSVSQKDLGIWYLFWYWSVLLDWWRKTTNWLGPWKGPSNFGCCWKGMWIAKLPCHNLQHKCQKYNRQVHQNNNFHNLWGFVMCIHVNNFINYIKLSYHYLFLYMKLSISKFLCIYMYICIVLFKATLKYLFYNFIWCWYLLWCLHKYSCYITWTIVALHIWLPIKIKLQWGGGRTWRPSVGREFIRNSVLVGINHFISSWLSLIFYRSQMPHLTIHRCIPCDGAFEQISAKF